MSASALLVAGASGANISRVVAVMAFFGHGSHLKASFLRSAISSNVNFCGVCAFIIYLFESVKNKLARKFTIGEMMSLLAENNNQGDENNIDACYDGETRHQTAH